MYDNVIFTNEREISKRQQNVTDVAAGDTRHKKCSVQIEIEFITTFG